MSGIIETPAGMVHLRRDTVRALAGTSGEPSDINKFVTDSDTRLTPITNTAPVNVTKATAAIGVSTEAARSDHKHDIATATAGSVGQTSSEGTSTSLARADHVHEGLSRLANDFAPFTEKTVTALTDYIIIEDSQDNFAKKKVPVGSIHASGSGVLERAQYSNYEIPVQAGATPTTYYSFTTSSVDAGSYRFGWSYEFTSNSVNTGGVGEIYIDNIRVQIVQLTPRQSTDLFQTSGFKYRTYLTPGTHTVRLDISRNGSGIVTFQRVDFEFWRIVV